MLELIMIKCIYITSGVRCLAYPHLHVANSVQKMLAITFMHKKIPLNRQFTPFTQVKSSFFIT